MNEKEKEDLSFNGLGIAEKLLATLKSIGMEIPTPIQRKAIPVAIEGKDLIGVAQTGTGKTLAFSVPMIQRLALYKGRGLVILPTRELASQVDESVRRFGAALGVRTAVLIGGESINRQRDMLRRNPHVIIVTPGRMNDFIMRGWIKLDDVKILVLDEADMMLDMGFAPQIETIINKIPKERQTMLFSATMPNEIIKLAARHMAEPIRVEVAPSGQTAAGINQEIFIIHKSDRVAQLEKLLKECPGSVLVFCRTKRGVSKLVEEIQLMGHNATEIHSNRSLEQRRKALAGFKNGKYRILVATDIAARGLDVNGIELVVNFDLPEDPGDYVHRIGRTGRAGKTGKAISFAGPEQSGDIRQIERLINKTLPLTKLAQPYAVRSVFSSSSRFRSAKTSSKASGKFSPSNSGRTDSRPSSGYRADSRPSSGFNKYKQSDSRPGFSSKKFKPQRDSQTSASGYGHGESRQKKEGFRSETPYNRNKDNKKGEFDPVKYFTERPVGRIMTDKERFRASLRGSDRPSFGHKKSSGSRPFHR
jgi:ATP-dependent RNA helicase RhlE